MKLILLFLLTTSCATYENCSSIKSRYDRDQCLKIDKARQQMTQDRILNRRGF